MNNKSAFNQEYQFPVGHGRVGVTQERVIDYCAMLREELLELCDVAETKMWGELLGISRCGWFGNSSVSSFLLEACCHVKKSYSSRKEALGRAYQLAPKGTPAARCVRETSTAKFTLLLDGEILSPQTSSNPMRIPWCKQ